MWGQVNQDRGKEIIVMDGALSCVQLPWRVGWGYTSECNGFGKQGSWSEIAEYAVIIVNPNLI